MRLIKPDTIIEVHDIAIAQFKVIIAYEPLRIGIGFKIPLPAGGIGKLDEPQLAFIVARHKVGGL